MRRALAYTWAAAIGMALLYLAWVGATRYLGQRAMERSREAARAPAQAVPKSPAGAGVKILHFYASTGQLTKGDRASVCYGVENARSVRIEPAVEELKPAMNRCFPITPEAATTYTLVAEGRDGTRASASFTVNVKPAPPKILFIALSSKEIRRGEPLTVCYGVSNADAVRLEPVAWPLRPVEKDCVKLYPVRTTNFTVVASGAEGMTDREKFTVKVR